METDNNVLELVAEEEQLPLEKVIDNTLVKYNITDAVIAAMKEKYGSLRLKSIDDKEVYLELKAASREIRKIEILAEKVCEHGRADMVKGQRLWISKQKEVLSKTGDIKNPIDADIDRYDKEIERKELEEARRREETFNSRQAALYKTGATYAGGSIDLKHISYETELIKNADDETWEVIILPKYKKVYEEIEAARVEGENKRKFEQELLQKQREEFEAQQKIFRDQQEEMRKQQAEMERQRDELNRQQRLEQEKKEAEERKNREAVKNNFIAKLVSLGMQFDRASNSYFFEDVVVSIPEEISEKICNELLEKATPLIEERKKAAEEKRAAKIADDIRIAKEEAAQKERDRIALEQRQAEEKRQQELAEATDKVKWADFVRQLNELSYPEMKSGYYRARIATAKSTIDEFLK